MKNLTKLYKLGSVNVFFKYVNFKLNFYSGKKTMERIIMPTLNSL